MRVEMKLSGVDHVLALLKSLPPEVVSKRGGPVRKALRKAAVVIRDEAKANVRRIVSEPNKEGSPPYESTGALEDAIFTSRGKVGVSFRGEKQIVWLGKVTGKYANTRLNRRKQRVGQEYSMDPPQFYGRFLEYGTSRMVAHPWLRPALATKGEEAINVATRELVRDLDRVVKALSKKAR